MWLRSYGDRAPINEDRLRQMRHALSDRMTDAKGYERHIRPDNPHLGASLAGRALAYAEAVAMLDRILEGQRLHRPRRVRRRDRARIEAIRAGASGEPAAEDPGRPWPLEGDFI